MNKHVTKGWVRNLLDSRGAVRMTVVVRLFVLVGVSGIALLGFTQHAHAVVSSIDYCSQYSGTQATACNDGIRGADCADYTVISDQAAADVCAKAKAATAAGQVTPTASPSTTSVSPTPTTSTDPTAALNQLSQSNNLTQMINALQGLSGVSNALTGGAADNNYASYVNGAGKQQPIKVMPGTGCGAGAAAGAATSAASGLSNPSTLGALSSLTSLLGGGSTGSTGATSLLSSASGPNSATSSLSTIISALGQAIGSTPTSGTAPTATATGTNASGGTIPSTDSTMTALSTVIQLVSSLSTPIGAPSTGSLGTTGTTGTTGNTAGLGALQTLTQALSGTTTTTTTTNPLTGLTTTTTTGPTSSVLNGIGSATGGSACPAIVWFNGGGWHADDGTSDALATGSSIKNDVNANDPNAENNGAPPGGGANQRGYTVIEVTYRLGSDGIYYMYDDVLRGLRHVINNAGLYSIDPSRIAVGGDSAGGSLAMRVVASGVSGAKVGVGWSAPTNAFTALFKSFQSFLIGMDHSTCVPTDLAGLDNMTSLLSGGSGTVATEGQGLSSNDFSSLGIGGGGATGGSTNPLDLITGSLTALQYASDTGTNLESISKQLETAYANGKPTQDTINSSGLPANLFNLSAKKLGECFDNFKQLSPALFASPNTPPTFNVEFDDDDLVDQQQAFDMRDKVRSLGGKADSYIITGNPDDGNHGLIDVTKNHLGYDSRAVCPTLNFLDSLLQPTKQQVGCTTPATSNSTNGNGSGTGGGGSSGGGGGGGGTSGSGSPSGCNSGFTPGQNSQGNTVCQPTASSQGPCVQNSTATVGAPLSTNCTKAGCAPDQQYDSIDGCVYGTAPPPFAPPSYQLATVTSSGISCPPNLSLHNVIGTGSQASAVCY